MNEKGFDEAQNHKFVYRPWGSFISIENGSTWQIKKIDVNPGASLSLQMHFHRSEHWIVVNGTAKVEVDNIERITKNEETRIRYITCSYCGQDPYLCQCQNIIQCKFKNFNPEKDIY